MRDTLHFHPTKESRNYNDENFSMMDIEYIFSTMLECEQCGEHISCCGNGGYEPYDWQNEDGVLQQEYELIFYPKFFCTPLKLFHAPVRSPNTVKEQLYKSFEMLFCDLNAAANHLRQCIEEILTNADIPARRANGHFLSLHERITKFEQIDPANAERINALKWIGNFGSHSEKLQKNDLFDAYDIAEIFLEDLYVGHHRNVRNIVEQINREKRPRR